MKMDKNKNSENSLNKIREERVITVYPKPYKSDVTPYWKTDFDEDVKIVCSKDDLPISEHLGICKAIFVGDVSVGKTSLVNKFCHESYESGYKATIGVDFEVEIFEILNIPFNLQIWDTAGQERFKCIAHSYYRNAQVIVVVFDTTNIQTLISASTWLKEALMVNIKTDIHIFLVGTKSDLLPDHLFNQLETKMINEAIRLNAELWVVSAHTGDNINALFRRIVAVSFNTAVLRVIEPINYSQLQKVASRIQLNSKKKKSKFKKCAGCS